MSSGPSINRLLDALVALEVATDDNIVRSSEIKRRLSSLRERVIAGDDLTELVRNEEAPRVVELLSANMAVLESAGAELRAAQALALRDSGLTIEAIAELFGVTRQRISALLKQRAALQPLAERSGA